MINVLCLHGCCQSEEVFRSYLKNMMRICKKEMNFFFMEGRFDHPDGGKTWYPKPLVVKDIGNIEYTPGLVGDTLDLVHEFIIANDIAVLLGFSQGGNVIDAYLNYKHPENGPITKAVTRIHIIDVTKIISIELSCISKPSKGWRITSIQ